MDPKSFNNKGRLEFRRAGIVLEALTRFVPPETFRAVLTQTGRHSQRIRPRRRRAEMVYADHISLITDILGPAL